MSRLKYIESLDDQSVIELIERPENYESSLRNDAMGVLVSRNLSPTRLHKLALKANEIIASDILKKDELLSDDVTMHESHFLDQEEIKDIYTQALKEYIDQKDQFRFDVWSYAIGGL